MLTLVPLELREANEFIENHHRHHKKVQGHRFSIGATNGEGSLVGVATVGRPVTRMINPKEVLEVTRLCTDGTRNSCSFLYSAAARIGKALGYKKIQTYILESENGASLRAAGWKFESHVDGDKPWHGRPIRLDQPTEDKQRWALILTQGKEVQ